MRKSQSGVRVTQLTIPVPQIMGRLNKGAPICVLDILEVVCCVYVYSITGKNV